MMTIRSLVVFLVFLSSFCFAYLPGISPRDYKADEEVHLKVNMLTSTKTQLPYDFYSLPFCQPAKIIDKKENLGEILSGARISNSLYTVNMLKNKECMLLGTDTKTTIAKEPWGRDAVPGKGPDFTKCTKKYYTEELDNFASFIQDNYRVNWLLDNMPAAVPKVKVQGKTQYSIGFPMGYVSGSDIILNNHVSILIRYIMNPKETPQSEQEYRIVGFEVKPSSVDYEGKDPISAECHGQPLNVNTKIMKEQVKEISWTYSVSWFLDEQATWATRWERYFAPVDTQIHWFSIVNSVLIIFFLTGMVAMILIRTLHADFTRYSQQLESQDDIDEKGWKLVYGDVFRTPKHPMALSVLTGFGTQVLLTAGVVLAFSVFGFMSPANRGSLLTGMIVMVVIMGIAAGYFGGRIYKMFKGTSWKRQAIFNAILIPGVIFGIFFILNFFIWGAKSSGAVRFTTLLGLVGLWFGISVPLVFLGSFFANQKAAVQHPIGVNQIPRVVPARVWYMTPPVHILMGGILPFGAVFIELFFVLNAVWGHKLHYILGFIFIVFMILLITCAEITVVMCYFQLCAEDYHWWWRSFLTSGATSFYFFGYSVFYFFTRLQMTSFVSILLYMGYTTIFTILFFVMTGCIGFYSCLWFVRKIYSSVPFE
eukprot:TRINITY_DN3191_c0_g1_i2.p1 TRINITY_DN3191_c0_g1~~TRINITY_DN3191_c0_g1_i2.p1  ORF type:complete len:650 (-),score=132.57 TRINITY_DN3191_c0_g1_i2:89-2038(-)